MKIQLKNNFHNTTATVIAKRERIKSVDGKTWESVIRLTDSQYARADNKLCGMKDCVCGGIRGPQSLSCDKLIVLREGM